MSSVALSVVEAEETNIYYANPKTLKIAPTKTNYNSRYRSALTNLGAGTSSFVIPAGTGIKNIVLLVKYSASDISGNQGQYILNRGWLFEAVRNISVRLSGSNQFFISGEELLAKCMQEVRTTTQANQLLQLAGNACLIADDFTRDQYATIPLSFLTKPSADGVTWPIALDLVSSPLQVTVELNPPSTFWHAPANTTGLSGFIPAQFSAGYFQCSQEVFVNRSDSLSHEVNMMNQSYCSPLSFWQQSQSVPLTAGVNNVVLSGIRSGEVKAVVMWLTKTNDALNPLVWYAPKQATLLYSGQILADYQDSVTGKLFNLLESTKASAVDTIQVSPAVGSAGPATARGVMSEWVVLPLSGAGVGRDYEAEVLSHGMEVLSGILNAIIEPPDAVNTYTLNWAPVFNCALVYQAGSCDFAF